MPNRILREGILTSERIASLGWPTEVFYRRLMSVVDDYGRYYATPMLLRAACYPLHLDKVSDADIEKWLAVCAEAALVSVYPALDGRRYLQLSDFRQQVRAKDSRFPSPDGELRGTCVADATQTPASAHLDVCVFEDVDVGERSARTKGKVTLPAWIDALDGADAIPADDPLFAWAKSVGVPREWIALAWWGFEARYAEDAKKYTDWRAVFRRAVREDWLHLWRVDRDGSYSLTTAGEQLRREMAS